MTGNNELTMEFSSLSQNLNFARVAVAAFASQIDFTIDELEEIKVIISEAVGNSIIHAYNNAPGEKVKIEAYLSEPAITIVVEDFGKGIEDVNKAMEPAYSTDEERMGLGFVFMQSFTEEMDVDSTPGKGTRVRMVKKRATGAKTKKTSPEAKRG